MNPTTTPPSATGPAPIGKPAVPWPDPEFDRNRARVPLSELQRWADRHVAWSWDGTRIVAGAETHSALLDELHRLGIETSTVVFGYVDDPDVSNI